MNELLIIILVLTDLFVIAYNIKLYYKLKSESELNIKYRVIK